MGRDCRCVVCTSRDHVPIVAGITAATREKRMWGRENSVDHLFNDCVPISTE